MTMRRWALLTTPPLRDRCLILPIAQRHFQIARTNAPHTAQTFHPPEARHYGSMSVPGLGKKKPRLRRDWRLAREKCDFEGQCRACGRTGHIEAAHVIGRERDYDLSRNERNIVVVPDRILPLCRDCHEKQHRNELEMVPLLSRAEQVQAVADVGIEGAMQRLSPGYNPRAMR